jgi:hypothetical protein
MRDFYFDDGGWLTLCDGRRWRSEHVHTVLEEILLAPGHEVCVRRGLPPSSQGAWLSSVLIRPDRNEEQQPGFDVEFHYNDKTQYRAAVVALGERYASLVSCRTSDERRELGGFGGMLMERAIPYGIRNWSLARIVVEVQGLRSDDFTIFADEPMTRILPRGELPREGIYR